MDATTEGGTIEREIEIAASPETVWELLTDPEEATRWMGLTATFELHRGGLYRVEVLPGDVARGEFVEIDPPRRLVFTWGWESRGHVVPPGSTTVEFELVPSGEGTTLRFRHRDLPTADSVAKHTRGWTHYLERLVVVAAGGDPGRDGYLTEAAN